MSNQVELSRELAESDMDADVKEFLRRLILLPESQVSEGKFKEILDAHVGGEK